MGNLPIYFINLATRPDRRTFMETQLAALGLRGERIEAISHEDLTAEQKSVYCNPARRWSIVAPRYACNLSHMKAWLALVQSGAKRALVLEDDALLSPRLTGFLGAVASSRDSIDIIRIERFEGRRLHFAEADQFIGGVGLRRCFSHDIGAAGYIISATLARRLLSERIMHRRLVDDVLFLPFSRIGRSIQVRYSDPSFCAQLATSEIARSDLSTPADAEHRLARRQHLLAKFSFQLERWFLEDIPQGAMELIARRGTQRRELELG